MISLLLLSFILSPFICIYIVLTITVTGRSKSTQARITLKADIFDLFSCECTKHSNATNQENEVEGEQGATNISISFVVQLQVLLGCLSLHGHSQSSESTMASLYYSTNKAILKLTLEEPGVLTVCDIQTLNLDDEDNPSLFLAFQESEEVAQIIIKSEPLKDAMQGKIKSVLLH